KLEHCQIKKDEFVAPGYIPDESCNSSIFADLEVLEFSVVSSSDHLDWPGLSTWAKSHPCQGSQFTILVRGEIDDLPIWREFALLETARPFMRCEQGYLI